MALSGKVEVDVEIKASADKFFKIFSKEAHHIPNICSDKIHGIEVHEGDWETPGSVKQWSYTLDGEKLNVKETVEVDEENKKVIFTVLDGDVKKHFKSLKATVHPVPKEAGGALVKWNMEFEALNDEAPSLDNYMVFAEKITKDIDDHLVKA